MPAQVVLVPLYLVSMPRLDYVSHIRIRLINRLHSHRISPPRIMDLLILTPVVPARARTTEEPLHIINVLGTRISSREGLILPPTMPHPVPPWDFCRRQRGEV